MKVSTIIAIAVQLSLVICEDPKSNQINEVNPDGSFQFAYQNNDRGGHYHQASGKAAVKVRGRYGARSPVNGKVEETVYTAGVRGFRARGPNIHRKQNLSQVPRSPVGSPTDPLADPYDDPSYSFGFKTKAHSRREEADSSGRVQGEFIYVDDVGEKHGVKYKAGANSGFEVENGVPDSPNSIRYNSPLYKTEPTARGRITFERGPDRQYKFLTSSPDQRRAETTGPDGITRGSYSYLDDKGLQRTVQYIAGAGIGYKVIQSTVGPGTHIAANSDVPEHSIKAASNEIAVANNKHDDDDGDEESNYLTGPSAPTGPGYVASTPPTYTGSTPSTYHPSSPFSTDSSYPSSQNPFSSSSGGYTPSSSPGSTYLPSPSPYPSSPYSSSPYPTSPSPYTPSSSPYPSTPSPFSQNNQEQVYVTTPSSIGHHSAPTHPSYPSGPSPFSPSGPSGSDENDLIYGLLPPREGEYYHSHHHGPTQSAPVIHITPSAPGNYQPRPTYLPTADPHLPQPFARPTSSYLPENPHSPPPHNSYPDAIIRNTSNGWFYGVPPGSALRAHIQNIDLVPTHDRALSPSEALRLDEERDARHHRTSHQ